MATHAYLPCHFSVGDDHLFAVPKMRTNPTSRLAIVYMSASPLRGINEESFNAFMDGYEFAAPADGSLPAENAAIKLVCNKLSASCIPYEVCANAVLCARFSGLAGSIPMVPSWYDAPIKMSDHPLCAEELAKLGVAREFVGDDGYVFAIFIERSRVPDTKEAHAIPQGFNNYARICNYFTWTLRWPIA